MDLRLHVFREVAQRQCASKAGGAGVPLSDFRKMYRIPPSTFHAAIRVLCDMGLILRVSRDRYSLTYDFANTCGIVYEDMKNG